MHWYAHITMATDELRAEFRRMRQQDRTPKDFGLKVRAHPDSLSCGRTRCGSQLVERSSRSVARAWRLHGLRRTRTSCGEQDHGRAVSRRASGRGRVLASPGCIIHSGAPFLRSTWVGLLRSFDVHPMNISFSQGILRISSTPRPKKRLQSGMWSSRRARVTAASSVASRCGATSARSRCSLHEGSILVSGRTRGRLAGYRTGRSFRRTNTRSRRRVQAG